MSYIIIKPMSVIFVGLKTLVALLVAVDCRQNTDDVTGQVACKRHVLREREPVC